MLLGDETPSVDTKTGVITLVGGVVALVLRELYVYLRNRTMDAPEIDAKKQKNKRDATKLDLSQTGWVLDKYQEMYDDLLRRVAEIEREHIIYRTEAEKERVLCREENAKLKERSDSQEKQIVALRAAVTILRKRVGDPDTGEHIVI